MSLDMQKTPLVSVIIPVYNDAARLRTCLHALEQQTYPAERFEVVVVDNGSTEDVSVAIPNDPRFTLVAEPSPGAYAARNSGIAVAAGEVLAFTDADCIPEHDWLEQAVRDLVDAPAVEMVGGAVRLFFKGEQPRGAAELYESLHAFPQEMFILRRKFAVTANMVTWRAVFARVGLFDSRLKSGGDADFGARVHRSGGALRYAPRAAVRHPARATGAELVSQARRVAGGIVDANKDVRFHGLSFLKLAIREVYVSIRKTFAVVLLGRPPDGLMSKALYLGMYLRLHGLQTAIFLRAALGRRTEGSR
jgi:glycosyltransferase involved in cell wall biosynthesis